MIKSAHLFILAVLGSAVMLCFGNYANAEDAWYENLESSAISYPVDLHQIDFDRKAIESDITTEISKPREELTSWQNSTQMMIKPAQNG